MPSHIEDFGGTCFLAFEGAAQKVFEELSFRGIDCEGAKVFGDLTIFPNRAFLSRRPYWCACEFTEPKILRFDSIGEAARALRKIGRNWAGCNFDNFRRAALIEEKLPFVKKSAREFPFVLPKSKIGVWALLDRNTMIFSESPSSPFPAGKVSFVEDHENPPSRAYLKLYEALVLFENFFGGFPSQDDFCLDAGASPGGWTWVLAGLGCRIVAVDRSPLAKSLSCNSKIKFVSHDAFTLDLGGFPPFKWIFSDVICYPERLYEWALRQIERDIAANFVCTIKMQGATDWQIADKFAEIPNSRVVHLCANKHELTWLHKGER